MSTYVDVGDLDDAFKDAKTNDFETLPDGEYWAEVTATRFTYLQNKTQERAFEWKFIITDGDKRGATVKKTNLLRRELLKWLKIDLKKLGVNFDSLSDLQQHQRDLWGLACRLKLQTKEVNGRDRQNIWLLNLPKPESDAPLEALPKEDEIPF